MILPGPLGVAPAWPLALAAGLVWLACGALAYRWADAINRHYLGSEALARDGQAWLALLSATAGLVVGWGVPALPATVGVAGFGALAVLVDSRVHLLPDRLTVAAGVAVALGVGAQAAVGARPATLLDSLVGLAIWVVPLGVGSAVRGGIGRGDAKFGAVLGAWTGVLGWRCACAGLAAGFALGGAWSLVLLARRRARGATRVAFGPHLWAGALLAWGLWAFAGR